MPIQLNHIAIARAKRLAEQGKIVHGAWDESKINRTAGNSRSFAAVDTDEQPDVQAHYKFPIIAEGKVNATAVGNALSRAKTSGYGELAKALAEIDGAIRKKEGALASKKAPERQGGRRGGRVVGMRGPTVYSDKSLSVDEEAGVLRNVALMTVGDAKGHGFSLDQTSIEQLVALAAQQPDGVKCRFKHPDVKESTDADGNRVQRVADDTGSMVGRIKGVRMEGAGGAQARGDVYLGSYAEVVPALGNVREYLIRHAKEDPAGIGMSAFFSYELEPVTDDFGNVLALNARLYELEAIDFVSVPAANPNGLLGAKRDDAAAPPAAASPGEFPHDVRGAYLAALVKDGPLHLGGLAARFNGRLEEMRATAEWLVNHGYAERIAMGSTQAYKATPRGITQAAMSWR